MNQVLHQIQTLLVRDLRGMINEIEAYPNDELVWETPTNISNSAGVLAMHACGNLNHYVGHVLGGSSYERDRNLEFAVQALARSEIRQALESTISILESVMPSINPERMPEPFPESVGGHLLNTQAFLLHLSTHLSFHLGQVGYLRRILTDSNLSTNPVSLTVLGLE